MIEIATRELPWSPVVGLGPKFLKIFFEHTMTCEQAMCIVGELDDRVVGFTLATIDSKEWHADFMQKSRFAAALALLPRLFNPKHAAAILRGLSHKGENHPEDPDAEILTLVVDTRVKRAKVGSSIHKRALAEWRERGIRFVKFGDIDVENEASNAFFGRGAVLHRQEQPYKNKTVNVWHFTIPDEE